MNAVLRVPSRRTLGSFRMGDPEKKDLERTHSVKEFVDLDLSRDEAMNLYQWALLMRCVQQKARFFSHLVKDIVGNPQILAVVRDTPYAADFLQGSDGIVNFSVNLQSTPHLMSTVVHALTALETVILPKHKLSAKGFMPNFNEVTKTLDRVAVGPINPSLEQLDFGDLASSTLVDDLHALNIHGKRLVGPQGAFIGALPGFVVALIVIGAVTIGTVVVAQFGIVPIITAKEDAIKRAIEAIEKSPNVTALLKTMGPEAVKQFMDRILAGQSMMGEFVDILKWGAIAVGALTVGGTVLYFMHR